MAKQNKKIGFIMRQPPYGQNLCHDALDALFATTSFEQEVSLFLLGDGVFILLPEQASEHIQQKSIEKKLSALPLYDVNTIYVCEKSLNDRQLPIDQIGHAVTLLSTENLSAAIHQQDLLLSF
jgi:tRNA 2-thiouridine synthesizing protein C